MIYGKFPEAVTAEGRKIRIDPDFRIFCEFEAAQKKGDTARVAACISDFFRGDVPKDINEAVRAFLDFYLCGTKPQKSDPSASKKEPAVYDYEKDRRLFISAFRQQYGIDLCADELHWWEFSALFAGLNEDTQLVKVMQIRSTDTSKIKNKSERSRIKALQERFSLGEKKRYKTAEEHHAAMLDEVRRRSEEIRRQMKAGEGEKWHQDRTETS